MEFIKYNRHTGRRSRGSSPHICFETKGVLRLNRPATEILNLTIGDRINLYQDGSNKRDWFIEKTTDDDGLVLRKHSVGGSLCCNSVVIVKQFFESQNLNATSAFKIAQKPLSQNSQMHAILTGYNILATGK